MARWVKQHDNHIIMIYWSVCMNQVNEILTAINVRSFVGIYLNEHRDQGGWGGGHTRRIVITLQGQS